MYERFTDRTREAMQIADREARRRNHEYLGPEHILLGIAKQGHGVAVYVLEELGVDADRLVELLDSLVQHGPPTTLSNRLRNRIFKRPLVQTPRTKEVMLRSIEWAGKLGHDYVGTEHILLGIAVDPGSVAAAALVKSGVQLEDVLAKLLALWGEQPGDA